MIVTIDEHDTLRIYYYDAQHKMRKDFMWSDDVEFITSTWTQLDDMNAVREYAERCEYEILHDDGEE